MISAGRSDAGSLREQVQRLPKVELHAHLEGSLPLRTLRFLAAKHRLPVPPARGFSDLHGFLKSFGAVCELLADPGDFELAAFHLARAARRRGVLHLEVLVSPQVFARRGIPLGAMMRGLLRGRRRAGQAFGLSLVYIADGVRQWGGAWFDDVVRMLAPYAGRGLAGIGVGGDEASVPARDFARAFRRARDLGLRTTIHAGEAAGPDSVREALHALRPDRIGHGFRAAEDPDLVATLVRRGITLEICPTSNVLTGAVASLRSHPVRQLYAAGALITVNSDDGYLFDTNVSREMELLARRFLFTGEDLKRITLHAARAAFLPRRDKSRLVRKIKEAAWPKGAGSAP